MASYADMLRYELTVPPDSAVPEATDEFLARLRVHRDQLESDEKSWQRETTGSKCGARSAEDFARRCQILVADDILTGSAPESRKR